MQRTATRPGVVNRIASSAIRRKLYPPRRCKRQPERRFPTPKGRAVLVQFVGKRLPGWEVAGSDGLATAHENLSGQALPPPVRVDPRSWNEDVEGFLPGENPRALLKGKTPVPCLPMYGSPCRSFARHSRPRARCHRHPRVEKVLRDALPREVNGPRKRCPPDQPSTASRHENLPTATFPEPGRQDPPPPHLHRQARPLALAFGGHRP